MVHTERQEPFCIRMVELSILAATLNGILISFTFEIDSALALLVFFISSSAFIASGMGFLFAIMDERCGEAARLIISRKMVKLSIILFFGGMICFLFGIGSIVAINQVLYSLVIAPVLILLIGYLCLILRHEALKKEKVQATKANNTKNREQKKGEKKKEKKKGEG